MATALAPDDEKPTSVHVTPLSVERYMPPAVATRTRPLGPVAMDHTSPVPLKLCCQVSAREPVATKIV